MTTDKTENISPSRVAGLFAGPIVFIILLFLPLGIFDNPDAIKVIAVAGWMIIWWITEATSLSVTALLPMILFPILGIFKMVEATSPYGSPIVFLFMGGFILALAMEKHNLHKRIALNLIRLTGTHSNGIILGYMIATAFLSMWISNTATTVMMLPIAMSVITLVGNKNDQDPAFKKFGLSLALAIAYSANIGGIATIIGTPPNAVLVGFMEQMYDYEVSFSQWLLVGVPISLVMLALTYFILTKVLFPSGLKTISGSAELIHSQLKELGSWKTGEWAIMGIFGLTAIMWIARQAINNLVGARALNDTLIAMAGGVLCFIFPLNLKKSQFLLNWEATKKLPWGILILFGGGLCLAKAMEKTGIIQLIGEAVASQQALGLTLLLLILIAVMLFMTEMMSNVALATIFLPVVMGIAESSGVSPLLYAIPVGMASSCAFMLPVSTPPNAIVFASGHVRVKDMMKAGIVLNIVAVLLLLLAAMTLIPWVYG